MNIFQRLKAPTPVFFQHLRNWGLMLTGLSAYLLGVPVDLPEALLSVAEYLAVAGAVLSGVSQATVEQE